MKKILLLLGMFLSFSVNAQLVKEIYNDFLKYGTVYATGDISNSVEAQYPTYILRTNDNGSLYSIPIVEDATDVFPFDYTYSIGIRKLARFDYD